MGAGSEEIDAVIEALRCVPADETDAQVRVLGPPPSAKPTETQPMWQRAAREERLRKVMLAKRAAQLINNSSEAEAPSTAEVDAEHGGTKRPNPDAGMLQLLAWSSPDTWPCSRKVHVYPCRHGRDLDARRGRRGERPEAQVEMGEQAELFASADHR
jgi:hypothetical protein